METGQNWYTLNQFCGGCHRSLTVFKNARGETWDVSVTCAKESNSMLQGPKVVENDPTNTPEAFFVVRKCCLHAIPTLNPTYNNA